MTEKSYYEQTDAQFKIRLPHELKDKIRASADRHNRTMTADIVARLEQSFEITQAPTQQDVLVMMEKVQEQQRHINERQQQLDDQVERLDQILAEIQSLKSDKAP